MNGSPAYRPATVAGSPPLLHMTGHSPPTFASHPHSRPLSGHSFSQFPQAYQPEPPQGLADSGSQSYFSLDSVLIPEKGARGAPTAVVTTAAESFLEVHKINDGTLERIGGLNDLKGEVLDAKILSTAGSQDPLFALRPLIAILVHSLQNGQANDDPASGRYPIHPPPPTQVFRTSVEVYSLRTGECVSQLYESPPVAQEQPSWIQGPTKPPAVGKLQIQACGDFVAIASGVSGEVFCYVPCDEQDTPAKFRCIAKFWTGVRKEVPIFSLGHRWLCIVPPGVKSRSTIGGEVPISYTHAKPFGVASLNAPVLPSVDAQLDVPNPDGFANKVARGVAQEVFKGAKWVGTQGLSAWNSYFNKNQTPSEQQSSPERPQEILFPPTHAGDESSVVANQGPTIVSIVDLQKLIGISAKSRVTAEPFATFDVPTGCSFLSFAPSGLRLMTVSENGDIQYVWGLMKAYPRMDPSKGALKGRERSSVSQLAKFTRFTPADVVDVAWSAPKEDTVAVLTEKGTIHIFRLPSTVFSWPLATTRRNSSTTASHPSSETPSGSTAESPPSQLPMKPEGLLGSAAATVRKRSSSGINTFLGSFGSLNISAATSLREGRRVASGVGRTASAAADALRHIDEDRYRLPISANGFHAKSLFFMPDTNKRCVAAVSNGSVKLHYVRLGNFKNMADRDLKITSENNLEHPTVHKNFWKPKTSAKKDSSPSSSEELSSSSHPLACAEIDSAPSYQPFFSDRRFIPSAYAAHSTSTIEPWAFGTAIESRPLRTHFKLPRAHDNEAIRQSNVPIDATVDYKDTNTIHNVGDIRHTQSRDPATEMDGMEEEGPHGDLNDSALMEHMANEDDADVDFSNWDVDADDLLR